MSDRLRCRHCGDVIGVYEPMITVVDGRARQTSRALEPDLTQPAAKCYHRGCFERLQEDEPGSE